jgi:prepilin peptidase CpaA
MNPLSELPLALACGVTLAAAWCDARTGRIPNLITLPVLPVGFLLGALDSGLWGLGSAVLGALLCLAVPYGLFHASRGAAIGGGDVKLFAALGALLGPIPGLEVELASLIVLAAAALVTLAWRGQLLACLQHTALLAWSWALPRARKRPVSLEHLLSMRLGPAICVATWVLGALQYLPARLFL